MKPGRSARLMARPVWSGPSENRKVAPAPWRSSIETSAGTPSRVPRNVSTSIFRASFKKDAILQPQEPDSPTPYQRLGGDAKVRELVERFYDLMDFEPKYARLRAVHGSTLASAREKLYMFLSGWLGGPALYTGRFGHP